MSRRAVFEGTRLSRRWLRNFSSGADDTIYALSSGGSKAGIAVIRSSGPSSEYILRCLSRRSKDRPLVARKAELCTLRNPRHSERILDQGLSLFFPNPHSYTGEDVVELHTHGGQAVVRAVLGAIGSLNGLGHPIRYAERGEFSRRAFENGRLDLTQIEAIRDIINAETEQQRLAVVESAAGQSRILYNGWRHRILQAMAQITALIDFSEDQDIGSADGLFANAHAQIVSLTRDIRVHLQQIDRYEIIQQGIRIALLGPPNAGKSSLLNAFAKRQAAIVSAEPGTTRDVLSIPLDIGGFKVLIEDTAGIRATIDQAGDIEREGIRRARQQAQSAHIVLVVLPISRDLLNQATALAPELQALLAAGKNVVLALNKVDLVKEEEEQVGKLINQVAQRIGSIDASNIWPISCKTGQGMDQFLSGLSNQFSNLEQVINGEGTTLDPIGASQRVKQLIDNELLPCLESFQHYYGLRDVVFASEELKFAAETIGKITGQGIDIEEVLGVVFESFCVGK